MDATRAEKSLRAWALQIGEDPRPIDFAGPSQWSGIPVTHWDSLPYPTCDLLSTPLTDVLAQRTTRRVFQSIDVQNLSTLLWWSQRRTEVNSENPDRSRGPIPTAGGLASVRTLVVSRDERPWIYDSRSHKAGVLCASPEAALEILNLAQEFMPIGGGRLLLFVAFRDYIGRYYESPESLVLREAGVLQGTMALLCELLGLAFCPLGTQGHDWNEAVLGVGKELIIPGGAAVVGSR